MLGLSRLVQVLHYLYYGWGQRWNPRVSLLFSLFFVAVFCRLIKVKVNFGLNIFDQSNAARFPFTLFEQIQATQHHSFQILSLKTKKIVGWTVLATMEVFLVQFARSVWFPDILRSIADGGILLCPS